MRWESRSGDGKSGYMPAAERDWKTISRTKREDRKKVDRQTRRLLPLTDKVIEDHLWGRHTVGVYPLLPDETCWFLAVDFDKATWQQDATAYLETCQKLNVPAALERSRSGNGGHVWIFFDRAISAMTARKLGCLALTQTMERRHQVGLDSYDRFFPNQDTMPKGGLGNLIALPLQFGPRKQDKSVFVDTELRPYPDQWAFLASIPRMDIRLAEYLVRDAQRTGDLIGVRLSLTDDDDGRDPWTLPPNRKRTDRLIEGPFPHGVAATAVTMPATMALAGAGFSQSSRPGRLRRPVPAGRQHHRLRLAHGRPGGRAPAHTPWHRRNILVCAALRQERSGNRRPERSCC